MLANHLRRMLQSHAQPNLKPGLASLSRVTNPVVHRCRAASNSAAPGPPALVDKLKADMKEAMKAKDQVRLDAIRFINAAIKSKEIELREKGGSVTDAEVVQVLQKSAKQRRDSIDSYKAGGREDLVAKEEHELSIVESYLPVMMTAAEVEAIASEVIARLGASSVKDMGKVMAEVKLQAQGRADNKVVSDVVKAKLTAK
ncbi:GatB/Yqey [Haematococcus lacustris]